MNTARNPILLILILGLAFCLTGCGEKNVATAENEADANQMFDILYSKGFNAEKHPPAGELKTWSITVDEGYFGEGQAAAAIQVLRDYGLPRAPEPEPPSASSPMGVVSDKEEKERQVRQLQRQIERQLYTLPDVIRASVIIGLPTDDIMSLDKTPPRASVTLVLTETEPKFGLQQVQNLVSGAVPNLKPENIQVAMSQQAVREIPFDKLEAKRRSNTVFFIGIGIIALLAGALAAVWIFSRRRSKGEAEEFVEEKLIASGNRELTAGEPAQPALTQASEE